MSARPKLRDIAADPTLALMLALGFSSGLPFLLILGTQAARLAEAKVPIEEIGLLSWVGLCYSLKFLWAPIIDEVDLPWLAKAWAGGAPGCSPRRSASRRHSSRWLSPTRRARSSG